ncbi:hypothetical protein PPNSA23_21260 [Phyllobacterium phragmitis]|uniref:Uncharacterized protein n=1 Tax=Phyllobacterium phragmitis TaxID=2670329 RepID=A0ABQ0GZT2_9HYPH
MLCRPRPDLIAESGSDIPLQASCPTGFGEHPRGIPLKNGVRIGGLGTNRSGEGRTNNGGCYACE